MHSSKSVLSDNYFFVVGTYALLTPELIDEYYYIIDIDAVNFSDIDFKLVGKKRVIAFISNDFDYYSLKSLKNISFLDKRSKLNEILSFMMVNNSQHNYQIKYQLSNREHEILSCMQQGMTTPAIAEKLGLKMKTFYTHRRNIMLKLRIGNRISLYRKIVIRESKKQEDDVLHESIL